jgi:plasmid stability protein
VATLQIRNFPDELKERLRARAGQVDLTMSDYVIRLVRNDLSMDEWLGRLAELPEHPELNLMGAHFVEEARAELSDE